MNSNFKHPKSSESATEFLSPTRREFLAGLTIAGGAWLGPSWVWGAELPHKNAVENAVETVFVVWKCHLDLGFTALASEIERQYLGNYLPQAMDLAEQVEREGTGESFTWTTGSWLIYEFLERADSTQRAHMERAIARDHIAWHALPHSFQGELMSRDLLISSLALSQSLDKRFGKTTTGAKLTDVPGQTRGLVAPLAEAGVKFLDIGGNPGSTSPHTPPLFRWREPGGKELCVQRHAGYGQTLAVPNSNFALCINVSHDNGGVPTRLELRDFMAQLHERFPRAQLKMASLSDMARAMETVSGQLPVWTGEIGDTWIHGAGSDPRLIAQTRELERLHSRWLQTGQIQRGDAGELAFARRLSLVAEHTWGLDVKTFLKGSSYERPAFERARTSSASSSDFDLLESSWAQKRARVAQTLELLPAALKTEATHALSALQPAEPSQANWRPFDASKVLLTPHFQVQINAQTGALQQLRQRSNGREWADVAHPLGLVAYQTFDAADFADFTQSYCILPDEWWVKADFGKPGLEKTGAQARTRLATLNNSFIERDLESWRLIEELHFENINADLEAPPARLLLEWSFPDVAPEAHLTFQWFDKPANRMPEALWLSFVPDAPDQAGWTLDKMGCPVSPMEVVEGGNRQMHAVGHDVAYRDERGSFAIETLDAPLVAVGERSLLNFSARQPDLSGGMHFNLWNNVWGTNYRMWFEENMKFRFALRV